MPKLIDVVVGNELTSYQKLMERFFQRHYPETEPAEFWRWFIKMLIGCDKDMCELTPDEAESLLAKLNELGQSLFDCICALNPPHC